VGPFSRDQPQVSEYEQYIITNRNNWKIRILSLSHPLCLASLAVHQILAFTLHIVHGNFSHSLQTLQSAEYRPQDGHEVLSAFSSSEKSFSSVELVFSAEVELVSSAEVKLVVSAA